MNATFREYRIVFRTLSRLFMFFSLILVIPLVWYFFDPRSPSLLISFLLPCSISLIFGLIMKRLSQGVVSEVITMKEGTVIVLISWLVVIFISALPYRICGLLNFSQAIFESTSGWTTTGLTMFTDVERLPKSILFWRSLTQYLGGAGFAVIVMSTLIGPTGLGFYQAEGHVDNIMPNIRYSARLIMTYYLLYAVLGTVALMFSGLNFFDALNHSMTALATGGFSTKSMSVAAFNNFVAELILILLMFIGATGFGIHHTFWSKDWYALKKNSEPRQMITLILLGGFCISLAGVGKFFPNWSEALRHGFFQVVSALTGTGFSTVDLKAWLFFPTGLFVLIILMLMGGCMDSTSGGIKQYRITVLLKTLRFSIKKFLLPKNSVVYVEIWKGSVKRYLDLQLVKEAFMIGSAYILSYIVGTFVLTLIGYDLGQAMFEFASALAGVGLSCGVTSPNMPLGAMWTLTLGMFMGRLEFFVVIYAFAKIFSDLLGPLRKKT